MLSSMKSPFVTILASVTLFAQSSISAPFYRSAIEGAAIAATAQVPLNGINGKLIRNDRPSYAWKAFSGALSGLQTEYLDTDKQRSVLTDTGIGAIANVLWSPMMDKWGRRILNKRMARIRKNASEEVSKAQNEQEREAIHNQMKIDLQRASDEFERNRSTLLSSALLGAENGLVYGGIRKVVNREKEKALLLPKPIKVIA